METTLGALVDQTPQTRKILATICLSLTCVFRLPADERIFLPVQIDARPVRLAFDTCMSHTMLFRPAAMRLGLKINEPPPDAQVALGHVKAARVRCELTIGTQTRSTEIAVVDSAIRPDCDGVLAWNDCRNNILQIVADTKEARLLDKLPDRAAKWPHWKLRTVSGEDLSSRWLGFEIPSGNGRSRVVLVDTGADDGLRLSPTRWKEWLEDNPSAPVTLQATYYPALADGLVVGEEYWAKTFELTEGLRLGEVPVSQSPKSEALAAGGYEVTLGLFALTRLSLIVDGVAGRLYIQAVPNPKTEYSYNRIGAVFTPRHISGGGLLARVIKGGPAYKAGVRDGDILMTIGDLDATKWQADPRIRPLSRFWSQPAGTKVHLGCRRGETIFNVTIELKEIFPRPVGPRQGIKN
jgi:hypothetical protein